MDYKWLAVPVLLILALGVALYLNQPKVGQVEGVKYQSAGGDEYLDYDYTTPEEVGVGEADPNIKTSGVAPKSLADCAAVGESEKDWCYTQYALYSGDEKGCALPGEQASKDDCFAQLALVENKPGLCDRVEVGRAQCSITIAVAEKNPSLCEKGKFEKEQCLKAVAAKSQDMCAKDEQRKICNDAVQANDAGICSQMIDYTEFCYYNIAVDTNSSSLCNKAGESRDSCFFKVALGTSNEAICENLTETRDNCIAWVAFNTGNKELCYKAGKETQSCLDDL